MMSRKQSIAPTASPAFGRQSIVNRPGSLGSKWDSKNKVETPNPGRESLSVFHMLERYVIRLCYKIIL